MIGPHALRTGRGAYNSVLQQTSNEQLLLNLVRMRYCDTPAFFEVVGVTTSFDQEATLGSSATIPEFAANTYGVSGGLRFA